MEILIVFILGILVGLMTFLIIPVTHLLNYFTSGTFFVALGAIATSCALVYTIFRDIREQAKSLKALKVSLENELLINIQSLFSGEVERPSLFDAIRLLRSKYSDKIVNPTAYFEIQKLYLDLEYYQTFVSKVYLKLTNGGEAVSQKQLSIINTFLEYFGESTWPLEPNTQISREMAIEAPDT